MPHCARLPAARGPRDTSVPPPTRTAASAPRCSAGGPGPPTLISCARPRQRQRLRGSSLGRGTPGQLPNLSHAISVASLSPHTPSGPASRPERAFRSLSSERPTPGRTAPGRRLPVFGNSRGNLPRLGGGGNRPCFCLRPPRAPSPWVLPRGSRRAHATCSASRLRPARAPTCRARWPPPVAGGVRALTWDTVMPHFLASSSLASSLG